MKKFISLMLTLMIFFSLSITGSAETANPTRISLNTPIKSSLLYECLFEDEEFDEAKFNKALESIEYIDPIETAKVNTQTDYAHIDSEIVRLGNGEGVTVKIETTPADIEFDDFTFHFDESLLDVTAKDIFIDTKKNKATLSLVIHAKKPCHTSFEIYETYQFFDEERLSNQNITFTDIKIYGMDPDDGRIVYVTPTGEKYHYSSECAGENSIATTMADVQAYEYPPCNTCVS